MFAKNALLNIVFITITLSGAFGLENFGDTNWMDSYRAASDNLPYRLSRVLFNDYLPVVSVIKPIANGSTGERLGAVVINLSMERLSGAIVTDAPSEELTIVGDDDWGRRRSCALQRQPNPHQVVPSPIFPADPSTGASSPKIDESSTTVASRRCLFRLLPRASRFNVLSASRSSVYAAPSARDSLQYFMRVPLDRFEERFRSVWRLFAVLLVCAVVVAVGVSVFLAVASYRPIDRLLEAVKHPNITARSSFQTEEIREIADTLPATVNANHHLHDELMGKLEVLERTQLLALQAQINPHFLYNTLDAIRWSAMELTDGDNNVAQMIASLARLLCLSLSCAVHAVTLAEELEQCQVLKLSLQPLIEHAYYHRIKPTRSPGTIEVAAWAGGETLHVRVWDDGRGTPEERLRELRNSVAEEIDVNDRHIGLKNVNQRIKLVFGAAWGLTIQSGTASGTTVEACYPLRRGAPVPVESVSSADVSMV